MSEVLQLPILDPKFSWTWKIWTALKHLTDHLLIEADQDGHRNAARYTSLFQRQMVAPRSTLIIKHRKHAKEMKKDYHKKLRHRCSTPEEIKAAIKQAFIDIAALSAAHAAGGIGGALKWAATIRMVGALFLGAPIGRPGEMSRLTIDEARAFLATGNSALERPEHKTAMTQGPSGKYIPPGWKLS